MKVDIKYYFHMSEMDISIYDGKTQVSFISSPIRNEDDIKLKINRFIELFGVTNVKYICID